MKKRMLILLIFIIPSLHIYSQIDYKEPVVIPTPPEITGLGKYIDFPVNNYTGITSENIPIWTINMKDFNLPISLNYHAKGIQVEEEASGVGLGWNLLAGGCITRSIRGEPDDYNKTHKYRHSYYLKEGSEWDRYSDRWLPRTTGQFRIGIFWHGKWDAINEFNPEIGDAKYYISELMNISNISSRAGSDIHGPSSVDIKLGLNDLEPDIFYFNFGPYSGKFKFSSSNGVRTIEQLSHENIRITEHCNPDGEIDKFTIIDDNGNSYSFSTLNRVSSSSHYYYRYNDLNEPYSLFTDVITQRTICNMAWNLTEIVTFGGQKINFEYIDFPYKSWTIPSTTEIVIVNSRDVNKKKISKRMNSKSAVFTESLSNPQLSSIKTPYETIIFNWMGKRADNYYKTPYLGSIEIKDNIEQSTIKSFYLRHSYFVASDYSPNESISIKEGYGKIDFGNYLDNEHIFYRLKLDEVEEKGKGSYKFYYNERYPLPSRLAMYQDAWGYYNGIYDYSYSSMIPTIYGYENEDYGKANKLTFLKFPKKATDIIDGNVLRGATNNPEVVASCMLNRIIYPTGGETKYEYEPNQFLNKDIQFYGGGVRIKSIKKYDYNESTPILERYYDYNDDLGKTSGKIITIPTFLSTNFPSDYWLHGSTVKNTSYTQLNSTQGGFVGYQQVTISNSSENVTGKTVYNYSCPGSYGEEGDSSGDNLYQIPNVKDRGVCSGNCQFLINDHHIQTPYSRLFVPYPNYDWARGLLLSEKIYDKDQLKRKIDYKYTPISIKKKSLNSYGINVDYMNIDLAAEGFRATGHLILYAKSSDLTNTKKVLSSKKETIFEDDSSPIEIETTYSYTTLGEKTLKISEEKIKYSNDKSFINRYRYLSDYSRLDYPLLKSLNALSIMGCNPLLESSRFIIKGEREYLINSTLVEYRDSKYPSEIYTLNVENPISDFRELRINKAYISDGRYESTMYIPFYDLLGNPQAVIKENGSETVYIWGYNYKYLIAEIKNATCHEVEIALGLNLANISKLASPDMSLIDGLRSKLPKSLITTYTYKPLVGMLTETDPQGNTIYYEYDDQNRLKCKYIKDSSVDKNSQNKTSIDRKIESYYYNYKLK